MCFFVWPPAKRIYFAQKRLQKPKVYPALSICKKPNILTRSPDEVMPVVQPKRWSSRESKRDENEGQVVTSDQASTTTSRSILLSRETYKQISWIRKSYQLSKRIFTPFHIAFVYLRDLFLSYTVKPEPEPAGDTRPEKVSADTWESSGFDPHLILHPPIPSGIVRIEFELITPPNPGRVKLYVHRGNGYSENDSFDLGEARGRKSVILNLGADVKTLRLDPCENRGRFEVRNIRITHLSAVSVGLLRLRVKLFGTPNKSESLYAAPEPGPGPSGFVIPEKIDSYSSWLEVNQWNDRRAQVLKARLSELQSTPLLSIVLPVFNPPLEFFERLLGTIRKQAYFNWEVCVCDDGSSEHVRARLEEWAAQDPRVRLFFHLNNLGISEATNSAAKFARGEFLVFVDHDDELAPNALAEIALAIRKNPDVEFVYGDDDKIDLEGHRYDPQFKPHWSPELLLSYCYVGHPKAIKTEVYKSLGGMRSEFDGSQDYDLALRLSEVVKSVVHIPDVLYHWRALPGSTAQQGAAKPKSIEAGRRAVAEALVRRNIQGEVAQTRWAEKERCGFYEIEFPNTGPKVSILIPTRDRLTHLRRCIESIESRTAYRNYEIVILDTGSAFAETLAYFDESPHRVIRVADGKAPFNFSAVNNAGVRAVDGEFVLFLNDDTEVLNTSWLSQMAGYAGISGVGAVGAKLVYPDGRVQHAGIVHGYLHGLAGHAFKFSAPDEPGYLNSLRLSRNCSAVTAACLLTRRELFLSTGGFDETVFSVAYNDVDWCYRITTAGQRIVYCASAELVHHEGVSRGHRDDPREPAAFRARYEQFVDPIYSPNLSLSDESFSISSRAATSRGTFALDGKPSSPRQKSTLAPVRALMCGFNLNWEGSTVSQFELTRALHARGIIDPIVLSPTDGPVRDKYEALGIPVWISRVLEEDIFGRQQYEKALGHFMESLRDKKVELIYGNTLQTFYAVDAAWRLELPSIWNPRESEPWQNFFYDFGDEIASRALECFEYPYRVLFVSDSTQKVYEELNTRGNFESIPNGLSETRIQSVFGGYSRHADRELLNVRPDDFVAVCIGTICERKGQLDLVDAICHLPKSTLQRSQFFIVGDRGLDYTADLHSHLQKLPEQYRSRVHIVKETEEVGRYLVSADALVMCSRLESYPRVILEGMAAGLPIITTPVFGVVEQVQEHVNALFYQPGDTVKLAEHLELLCSDVQLRNQVASNSPYVLTSLPSFEYMIRGYAQLFSEAWLSGTSRLCAG